MTPIPRQLVVEMSLRCLLFVLEKSPSLSLYLR